eukprot:766488-Hanusia_phi.AAC.2
MEKEAEEEEEEKEWGRGRISTSLGLPPCCILSILCSSRSVELSCLGVSWGGAGERQLTRRFCSSSTLRRTRERSFCHASQADASLPSPMPSSPLNSPPLLSVSSSSSASLSHIMSQKSQLIPVSSLPPCTPTNSPQLNCKPSAPAKTRA